LEEQLPDLDEGIRFVVPILLDNVAVELGPWSGYHVLAQHRSGGTDVAALGSMYNVRGRVRRH
jgi:hypothetical protein